jgi:chromosome segregation ATPase
MALFQNDPAKTLQREIDKVRANQARLAAKLAESETVIAERQKQAHALALDGQTDDAELDRAEAATRAMQDRNGTIVAAKIEVTNQLEALERNLAQHLDEKTRSQTVVELEHMARDLEMAASEIGPTLDRIVAITGRASAAQIWDANGMLNFASASKTQIPDGIKMVVRAMKEHAARVLDGRAAPVLLKPTPVRVPVSATAPEAKDIFTYTDPIHAPVYRAPLKDLGR